MPDNQAAKNELRLQQAVTLMRAVIDQFGEPMVLDALAVICETPDGKDLLATAARLSRSAESETRATGSRSPGVNSHPYRDVDWS